MTWYKATDGWNVEDICHAANDHIVAALILFDRQGLGAPQVLDSAGFLAHLGFELLLKAALLHLDGKFPNQHNLFVLRKSLSEAGCDLNLSENDSAVFDFLSDFHRLRYHHPDGLPAICQHDRDPIYKLYRALRMSLPEQISDAIDKISHAEKSGRNLWRSPLG